MLPIRAVCLVYLSVASERSNAPASLFPRRCRAGVPEISWHPRKDAPNDVVHTKTPRPASACSHARRPVASKPQQTATTRSSQPWMAGCVGAEESAAAGKHSSGDPWYDLDPSARGNERKHREPQNERRVHRGKQQLNGTISACARARPDRRTSSARSGADQQRASCGRTTTGSP